MNYLEKINHYIDCLFTYFDCMIYDKDKENRSYYINEYVDKVFEFEKWVNSITDDDIMYNCDYDKEINPKEIRGAVKSLIKSWVTNNCKGEIHE